MNAKFEKWWEGRFEYFHANRSDVEEAWKDGSAVPDKAMLAQRDGG